MTTETFEQQVLRIARSKSYSQGECSFSLMNEAMIEVARALAAEWFKEPVAHVTDRDACMVWWNDKFTDISQAPKRNTPLYTKPEEL